ncbi:hypothetical protein ACLKA6_019717 [Drosophila palustris]
MSITDNFYATTTTATAATSAATATAPPVLVNPLTSRSPNPKRSRTSPISVPGSNVRQRQESTSSNGSWQVVTDTGSIDSMMNGSYMMRFVSQQQQQTDNIPICNGGNGYHCTINSMTGAYPNTSGVSSSNSNSSSNNTHGFVNSSFKDMTNGSTSASKQCINLRKQRLNAVRAIFIQAYGKTIGLKFKEGSSMNLATFIGNLADQLF